jgi:hypothetical protein
MNEVRNPIRTLKSVSVTALLTACVMYLLVNVAYFIVVPLDEIKDSQARRCSLWAWHSLVLATSWWSLLLW